MDLHESLSDRLIDNIGALADFIEPILTGDAAEMLLGEEAAPLLRYLDGKVITNLAFISEYLRVIHSSFDGHNMYHAYARVEAFVESGLSYYRAHLDGWDDDDDGTPLGGIAFLGKLNESAELFGFSCERTGGLRSCPREVTALTTIDKITPSCDKETTLAYANAREAISDRTHRISR